MPSIVLAIAIAGAVGMETFLGGIALAGVTALAWIAYNHPVGYKRLYRVLSWGGTIVFVSLLIFDVAYTVGWYAATDAARKAVKDLPPLPRQELFGFGWVLLIYVSMGAYLLILSFLHPILGTTRRIVEDDKVKPDE